MKELIFYKAYKLLWIDLQASLSKDTALLHQVINHGLIDDYWDNLDLNEDISRRTRFLREYFYGLKQRPLNEATSNVKAILNILLCLQMYADNYIEIEHEFLESSWKKGLTPLSYHNLDDLVEVRSSRGNSTICYEQ